jgi:predicted lipoprotein with Yx(FWY)xxD motif
VNRLKLAVAGASLALLALTACGSDSSGDVPAEGSDIGASDTSLGTIVVDGKGMAAYVYDQDTPGSGKSACSGACAEEWPAITASSDKPKVDGVTGEVGTIAGADGAKQVTLEGMPLYTYEGDSDVGDVKGQGMDDVWWVVSPGGDKITKTADSGDTGGGGY